MYIRRLNFSCYLVSLYPPVHFQYDWVASSQSQIIMVIMHLPERYLSGFLPKVNFYTVSSTLQFSVVFLVNFMSSSDILYILRQSIICGNMSYVFLLLIHVIAMFSVWIYSLWGCVDQYIVALLLLAFPSGILLVSRGTDCGLLMSSKSPP